ncbi:MAG TPA: sensor histidine kinase, partial [Nocardioides sp.]|nr:sensor histidine kinase [Nocardioides sp.]
MTTVAATADPGQTGSARPERSGASVRVRITAAVALLTLLALSGAGLIVYVIESQRIDQEISDRVDKQFQEFQKFQAKDGASYPTVGQLLNAFLAVQVPDDDEALVTWYGGAPHKKSSHGYIGQDEQAFAAAAARIAENNGTTHLDDPEDDLVLNA